MGVHRDVRLEPHVDVDPRGAGVDHRHAGAHPRRDHPVAQQPARRRQLHPVVDAQHLVGVVRGNRGHRQPGAAEQRHHVGEVLLAGGVLGGQPRQRHPQRTRGEDVHPGVDLGDGALGGVGVLLLDDGDEQARAVAHDPAVPGRVVDHRRQHRGRRSCRVVGGQQRGEGAGGEQGRVTGGHDHGPVPGRRRPGGVEGRERRAQGVAGPALLLLHGGEGRWVQRRDVGGDRLATVPDDHDGGRGLQGAARGEHVAQQGPAADRVQHLRRGRHHPGALARGEDHERGGAHGHQEESVTRRTCTSALLHRWGPVSRVSAASDRSGAAPGREGRVEPSARAVGPSRAPGAGIEPASLVLIQSQAAPASRATRDRVLIVGAAPTSGPTPGGRGPRGRLPRPPAARRAEFPARR